ncbi:hypothetical protein DB347_05615 [Opitutaceae bacterium EW11]|nr:hypothetical protein DB347_05615 [Opitutaceae bacterium EW11]
MLLAAAGLYVIYLLVGFFVLPSILKTQIERRASAQLKREVRVGRVAFNPLTLSLRIEKLMVIDHDHEPLMGWSSLFVNFQLFALLSDEVHFSEIELDGFAARLSVSKQGVLNIADITAPQGSADNPGKAWILRIDRLAVNRAEFDYSDESRAEPFKTHLGPTTFVLREFRTSGAGAGAPGVFSARTEAGESLQWTGRLALAPLRSNGEVRVEQVALKKYAPYYSGLVQFDILNGTLDAQIPYVFSIEHNQPQVKLSETSVQVRNVELAERHRADAIVVLKSIDVAQGAADLQARTVEVNRVVLAGGRIVARRDANGINLARLAGSTDGSAGKSASAGGAWNAKVNEVSAKDFAVTVEDRTTPRPASVELNNLVFSLKRFSLADLGVALPVELRAGIAPGGGELRAEGTVGLQPLTADLSASVEGTSLAPLSPWVESLANVRVTDGVASIRAKVRLKPPAQGAMNLSANADVDLSLVKSTDAGGADLASWKSLAVHGIEYSSTPARLTVADVTLADPTFNVVAREDKSLNVSTLLRQQGEPASRGGTSSPEAAGPFIAIDRIALANGSVLYADESVQPNVRTSLDQLSGTVTGLTSAAIDRGEVNLNGRIAGAASVSATGKVNVLSDQPAVDVRIDIRNSDLSPLGPYIAKFIGYKLSSGSASLDARARVANRRLDSSANLVVENFNLGDATNSPDAPHVPIHLALALLRDAQGKITIDLPVQGSLDDPSFQIGPVVTHVIVNLITRAATSPFSLIGAMFGGGRPGEDLSVVSFAVGSSELDPSNAKKLDVVGKALRERPGLRLAVVGSADTASDLATLRDAELERRIREEVFVQARALDPTITTPDRAVVSREAADAVIAHLYRELILKPQETVIGAPPPAKSEAQPERKRSRWFFVRWFSRDKPEPPAQASTKPKPSLPAPNKAPTPLPNLDEMRAKVKQALPIGEAELNRLANDRAERVRRYLVQFNQVDPARMEVGPAARGGARVNLQLR